MLLLIIAFNFMIAWLFFLSEFFFGIFFSDLELLEACREEFHRRLKVYQ